MDSRKVDETAQRREPSGVRNHGDNAPFLDCSEERVFVGYWWYLFGYLAAACFFGGHLFDCWVELAWNTVVIRSFTLWYQSGTYRYLSITDCIEFFLSMGLLLTSHSLHTYIPSIPVSGLCSCNPKTGVGQGPKSHITSNSRPWQMMIMNSRSKPTKGLSGPLQGQKSLFRVPMYRRQKTVVLRNTVRSSTNNSDDKQNTPNNKDRVYHARRAHRKSRFGCLNCKRRRVKVE